MRKSYVDRNEIYNPLPGMELLFQYDDIQDRRRAERKLHLLYYYGVIRRPKESYNYNGISGAEILRYWRLRKAKEVRKTLIKQTHALLKEMSPIIEELKKNMPQIIGDLSEIKGRLSKIEERQRDGADRVWEKPT
jgi:hypothetical protein